MSMYICLIGVYENHARVFCVIVTVGGEIRTIDAEFFCYPG